MNTLWIIYNTQYGDKVGCKEFASYGVAREVCKWMNKDHYAEWGEKPYIVEKAIINSK